MKLSFHGAAIAALLFLAHASPAFADDSTAVANPCLREKSPGDTFKICFDPGNRLYLSATSNGYGGGLQLRHRMLFDDEPDLTWKLEHHFGAVEVDYEESGKAVLYRGRFLRHARDGHIVLPFGLPRKVFVPFDVGADVLVGDVRGPINMSDPLTVGMIRTTGLIDLFRSDNFRRRVALGIGSGWDLEVDRDPFNVSEHIVAPLSLVVLDAHYEAKNGLTSFSLRAEAGGEWSSVADWRGAARVTASAERVLIAVNDRPLSLFASAKADRGKDQLLAELGFRFAAF